MVWQEMPCCQCSFHQQYFDHKDYATIVIYHIKLLLVFEAHSVQVTSTCPRGTTALFFFIHPSFTHTWNGYLTEWNHTLFTETKLQCLQKVMSFHDIQHHMTRRTIECLVLGGWIHEVVSLTWPVFVCLSLYPHTSHPNVPWVFDAHAVFCGLHATMKFRFGQALGGPPRLTGPYLQVWTSYTRTHSWQLT